MKRTIMMKKTRTEEDRLYPPDDLVIASGRVRLRSKTLADAKDDYAWQRDEELARLDATEVLKMPFSEYLINYVHYINAPPATSVRFAVATAEGRHIGNCTYYNIDAERGQAEVGIMIGDRAYWEKGYGTEALNAMLDYVFQNTSLNLLYLKTLDWNLRAQRCFARCGFVRHGTVREYGRHFLSMRLTRKDWQKKRGISGEKVGQAG